MGQSLLDFSGYIKFFVGLFALVNPVGILPVFISMTSYQAEAGRNKTNLTANLSVAIILCTSLFLGEGILRMFGISIDSFRIAGGILVVTIAMSMISGKLGEDKQNKQEKSESAIRESIGVVPLALPLMAGPGRAPSAQPSSGARATTAGKICWASRWRSRCSPSVAGYCSARRRCWCVCLGKPASTSSPASWGYC
ncbi:membrane protein, MarC family [Serratia ficaria]|nr:membrane protein, MarC family [Serratia ficaria]